MSVMLQFSLITPLLYDNQRELYIYQIVNLIIFRYLLLKYFYILDRLIFKYPEFSISSISYIDLKLIIYSNHISKD